MRLLKIPELYFSLLLRFRAGSNQAKNEVDWGGFSPNDWWYMVNNDNGECQDFINKQCNYVTSGFMAALLSALLYFMAALPRPNYC